MIQRNLNLDYLKNCANCSDRTIEMVQHFPPVPFYSGRYIPCIVTYACFNIFFYDSISIELLKLHSLQQCKAGDIHSRVADLVDSHGVGLCHQNLQNPLGGHSRLEGEEQERIISRIPCGRRKGSTIVDELDKPVGEIVGRSLGASRNPFGREYQCQ